MLGEEGVGKEKGACVEEYVKCVEKEENEKALLEG